MYMEVCTLQIAFVSERRISFNDILFIEKLPNGERKDKQETSAKNFRASLFYSLH